MAIPDYGALPLAKFFLLVRLLSLIAMISIVGMTANFVAEIVSTNYAPPREVVGALAITCIATLYTLVSVPFFYAHANLGLLIMTGIDSALLLSFSIISIVFGKPLSFLNCPAIANGNAADNASASAAWLQSIAQNMGKDGSALGLGNWAGSTRVNCFETKAIWGLCIALCILFTCSSLVLPTLFFKAKKAGFAAPKSVV